MKTIFLVYITFLSFGFKTSSDNLPNIPIKEFSKLFEGDWRYSHTIGPTGKFSYSGEDFAYNKAHIYFKISVYKNSRLANHVINSNYPWLKEFRKESCLSKYEIFGDNKGYPEYPLLAADSVNDNNELIKCRILTHKNFDKEKGLEPREFIIERLNKDSLAISGFHGESENLVHYYYKE